MSSPEIYTLSLHDALPILHRRLLVDERRDDVLAEVVRCWRVARRVGFEGRHQHIGVEDVHAHRGERQIGRDRKSTRLNSSHLGISYAVFCLKKKKKRLPY